MVIVAPGPPRGQRVGQFIIGPSNTWTATIAQGTSTDAVITIYNEGEKPARITKVTPGGEAFTVKLDTLVEGKRYLLTAKSSTSLSIGRHRQVVKLATDSSETPELEVRLDAVVSPPLIVRPEELAFGVLPISKDGYDVSRVAKFVNLIQVRGAGLEVKKVTPSLPFLKVEIMPEASGQTCLLKVMFDKEKLTKGEYKGTIKVETNNPQVPVLEIPVTLTAQ